MGIEKRILKKTFKASARLEPFYSGGPATLNHTGTLVACACGEEAKARASWQILNQQFEVCKPVDSHGCEQCKCINKLKKKLSCVEQVVEISSGVVKITCAGVRSIMVFLFIIGL